MLLYMCCREGTAAAVVVYPAKSLMARDLALVCHYQGLPLVARPGLGPPSKPSVNALSAAFVEVLQSNVPSAVSTVHRTAARLQVGSSMTYIAGALSALGRKRDWQLPSDCCPRNGPHWVHNASPMAVLLYCRHSDGMRHQSGQTMTKLRQRRVCFAQFAGRPCRWSSEQP